jgi:ubiquinone/menaquinone biosynthesis C-methylase UbiE
MGTSRIDLYKKQRELRGLWTGFWMARPLLTANNLRVFDHLRTPKTAAQTARAVKADARATGVLLDALAGLGIILKSRGEKYRNTPWAEKLLVSGSPYYQGEILKHADNLWRSWSGLDEAVRTGRPVRPVSPASGVEFDRRAFIMGMHNIALFRAEKVLKAIGLKGVKTALDLGGGPGTYAMEMAKKGIAVTLFDRPDAVKIASGFIKDQGVKNINYLEGDFLVDGIGKGYDLVFLSNILHSSSPQDCRALIKKVKRSLRAGGRASIQEFYLAEDRTHPLHSALFSINMLVNTPAGRCYTERELRGFLKGAGLGRIKSAIIGDSIVITGSA